MSSKLNHSELWNNVLNFDFDLPFTEYGFSTRLAAENYWTEDFTKVALLEYKKFMFLAGVSDNMVSPSSIIDVVWHQHLVFTKSYADFCAIIGKSIQHIPSTHTSQEAYKFKQATERTKNLYHQYFGEQPEIYWNSADIWEPLNLPKARFKLRSVIIAALLVFIVASFPLYQFLRPIYIKINSPDFLFYYGLISGGLILVLLRYNSYALKNIFNGFTDSNLIRNLSANELIYLNTQNLLNVVYASIDRLIKNGKLILEGRIIKIRAIEEVRSVEEFTVLDLIQNTEKVDYNTLLNQLLVKPYFRNIAGTMDGLQKYIQKSQAFAKVFYINLGILLFILMGGFLRYLTGISRDKPVILIFISLVVIGAISVFLLKRLTRQICTDIIPRHFKSELKLQETQDTNDWNYFLLGQTALSASLVVMMDDQKRKWKDTGTFGSICGGSSSDGGSSCGSSCSSCGGCGGGGD
jgi:hypothetical protein